MESSLRRAALSFLQDHRILHRSLAPQTILLEAAVAAGRLLLQSEDADDDSAVVVKDAALGAPLALAPAADPVLAVHIHLPTGVVAASSSAHVTSQRSMQHMTAQLSHAKQIAPPKGARLPSRNFHPASSHEMATARLLPSGGGEGIVGMPSSSPAAFAAVLGEQHRYSGFWIHPAVVDASLQLAAAFSIAASSSLHVSVGMGVFGPMHSLDGAVPSTAAACNGASMRSSHSMMGSVGRMLTIADNQFKSVSSLADLPAAAPTITKLVPARPAALSHPAPAAASLERVTAQLVHVVGELLGTAVDPDQPLMEAGLDSIGAVELKNAVSSNFGIDLPATVSFDYPSVAAMAGFIAQRTAKGAGLDGSSSEAAATAALAERRTGVLTALTAVASRLVGAEVDGERPLMEAGLDSIGERARLQGGLQMVGLDSSSADSCMLCVW
jgi:acyl carrier protein